MNVIVPMLTRIHKPDILRHLAELSDEDLWLRFGRRMRGPTLERYVDGIDTSAHRVLGIYEGERKLIGFTHLVVNAVKRSANLEMSVWPEYRRRGYGEAMLRRALLHAAHLGLETVHIHLTSENLPMMALARKLSFEIARRGSEAIASKTIEKPAASVSGQTFYDRLRPA
jgi:RimJ/RimL family protein N-acetyltransferase